ncbi:MAG: hypothetical protein N3D84_02105 [Candidatus Woesearchaeota archaeon]|nr:hypothetical protein [Candidatus Woesearchaeota archaeon]
MAKKRGYFFTLDVLIALIIIVIGFLAIWSSIAARSLITQPYFLAQDLLDFLQSTKNKDVSSLPYVTKLIADGNITNYENTVLEQIGLFYYLNSIYHNKQDILYGYTKEILSNATPEQYSFEFLLNGSTIYTQQGLSNKAQKDSDSLISAKTIVVVSISRDELPQTYIAEVRVWQ